MIDDYRYYEAYRKCLNDFLQTYKWDWFCGLNAADHNFVSANSYVKKFAREIGKQEHIRVCCIGLMTTYPQLHIHLLMAGLDKHGHTLSDRDKKRSERVWQNMTRGSADIQAVYDDNAEGYISYRNTLPQTFELAGPYGLKLLERKRLIKANPQLAPKKSSWHPDYHKEIIVKAIPQSRRQVITPTIKRPNYILRKAVVRVNG